MLRDVAQPTRILTTTLVPLRPVARRRLARPLHPLLELQATAGNAAVTSLLGEHRVQRLMTGQQFKDAAGVGRITTSGIFPAIAALLDELRPFAGPENALKPSQLMDTITKAEHVAEDCQIWLKKHSMETGTSADRRKAAARSLEHDATAWATRLRTELARKTGLKAGDFAGGSGTANVIRVKEKRKAESMDSFLDHFGKLVDVVVPSNGVKAEIEVEVDFPVDPSGVGFVGLRFKAEADRSEAEKLKIRTEAAIAGGAKIPHLARIKAEFGGYIESQGKTSTEAMKLFSYGLYRLFRESPVVPEGLTNALWGGGATGGVGYQKSEQWATEVEKRVMKGNKDAYVEAGLLGGVGAEIGGPLAKGKFLLQAGGGSRYDAAGIEAIAKSKGAWDAAKLSRVAMAIAGARPLTDTAAWSLSNKLAESKDKDLVPGKVIAATAKAYLESDPGAKKGPWFPARIEQILSGKAPQGPRTGLGEVIPRGAGDNKGETTAWIKGSGEASFGPGVAGLKLESNWVTRGRDRRTATHFREAKFELKAGLKVPLNQLVSVGYGAALSLATGSSSASEALRAMLTKQDKEATGNKAARGVGSASAIGASFAPLLADIADAPAKAMTEGLSSSPWSKAFETKATELQLSTTILLSIEGKLKPPTPAQKLNGELNLSFSEEKSVMFADAMKAMTADFARVSAKQTTRLLRGQKKSDGAWQIDILGHIFEGPAKAPATTPSVPSGSGPSASGSGSGSSGSGGKPTS